MKLHIDIETGDPDDLFMLAIMATHPRVDLLSVTVFPGGRDQVGLVKRVLQLVGRADVPVGANVRDDGKSRVGKFYERWVGKTEPCDPDTDVVGALLSEDHVGSVTLLTGGPLSNVHRALCACSAGFHVWTCQGGFVGSNMTLPGQQLEKFAGQNVVPTFNLNGDPNAAQWLLSSGRFGHIRMVGKNVCHGYVYDEYTVLPKGKHAGLDLMIEGLECYCKKKPEGKAMHDLLAASMHLSPENGFWVLGRPHREKGKWGFRGGGDVLALVGIHNDGRVEAALAE